MQQFYRFHQGRFLSVACHALALCGVLLTPTSISFAATTLSGVVDTTLATHPQLMADNSRTRSLEYTVVQARSGFFPQMSFFAQGGREWSKSPAVASTLIAIGKNHTTLNREEYHLNLDQLLFSGGRVYGSVKKQKYLAQSSKHETTNDKQQIALRTVESYLDVLKQREFVKLAKKNIERHESTLKKVKQRVTAGASKRVELQLAEARVAQAYVRLERFQGDLAAAEGRYLAVTQMPVTADMEIPQSPLGALPATQEAAIEWAQAHSPNVLRGQSNVSSTRAGVTVARSNFFPTVTARLSASDGDNLDGIKGPPRNQDAMASVVVNYDFFNGFRDYGAVREAQELVNEATHQLEDTQLTIVQNIKVAWANFQTSQEQVYQFQNYVRASQKVVDDYIKLFILGERALFNVLDQENETFNARVSLANAKFDSLLNLYRIFAAMGNLTDILTTQ